MSNRPSDVSPSATRRLGWAVGLFLLLDFSVLTINLWIAQQVALDAVAINLAGRQRMLSQQMTKAALLSAHTTPAPPDAVKELEQALSTFDQTLGAFATGGAAQGGDGQQVTLRPVADAKARQELQRVRGLLDPALALHAAAQTTGASPAPWTPLRDYLVAHNRDMLAAMNRFTSELERESVHRVGVLRGIQTGAFLLALVNFVFIVLDLVRRHKRVAEDSLRWQQEALRDPLTQLFNRAAFHARLNDALARARLNRNAPVAVLMLDLDGFKPINDEHGHDAGDAALKTLAACLQSLAREKDTVARLGGDEFALVCPDIHGPDAVADIGQRIVSRLGELQVPGFPGVRLKASVGVAVFPGGGLTPDTLLATADRAMYASKRGRGSVPPGA